MRTCIMYYLTILANLGLLAFVMVIFYGAHGPESFMALLIAIPPILSLICIYKGDDREERSLKKRLSKAHLRKELKELKEFDN